MTVTLGICFPFGGVFGGFRSVQSSSVELGARSSGYKVLNTTLEARSAAGLKWQFRKTVCQAWNRHSLANCSCNASGAVRTVSTSFCVEAPAAIANIHRH
eukprot:3013889-Amphidinium_carterae.1